MKNQESSHQIKRKTTAGNYLRKNVKQLIKQICAAVDPAL